MGIAALVAMLSVAVFGGSLVIASLRNGLASLEARMGADIIVAPKSAASTHNLEAILLDGVPGYFYMDKSFVDKVAAREGVEKVSPQYYLASIKAGCCSMPVQIIGFDPQTDFTIQPWIDHSYTQALGTRDVVVGCNITGAPGSKILFYGVECTIVAKLDETGTALDNAAYCNVDTIKELIRGSRDQGVAVLDDKDPEQIVSTIQVKVADGHSISSVVDDINLYVRGATAVRSKAMTSGVADSMAGVSRVIGILIAVVWAIAAMVLAVTFWVLGRQRTKEFAVLRVLGARAADLSHLVVVESFVVCCAGAVAGVLIAGILTMAFCGALEDVLGLPFLLPNVATLALMAGATVLVVLVAGMLSSVLTARKIAKVDASQILRDE